MYNDVIDFNIFTNKGTVGGWNNSAEIISGQISFDINTSIFDDKIYNIKGLGQKWTDDAFEIWNNKITSVKTEWTTNPDYPEGKSLGYKEFFNVYYETGDAVKAFEQTTFYKTMAKKGFIYYNPQKDIIIDTYKVKVILRNKP